VLFNGGVSTAFCVKSTEMGKLYLLKCEVWK